MTTPISMNSDLVLHLALVASGLWSIVCRLNLLDPSADSSTVAWQHIALGAALAGSLVVPREYATHTVLVGLLVFQAAGAKRWRNGAPDGVRKRPMAAPTAAVPAALRGPHG